MEILAKSHVAHAAHHDGEVDLANLRKAGPEEANGTSTEVLSRSVQRDGLKLGASSNDLLATSVSAFVASRSEA